MRSKPGSFLFLVCVLVIALVVFLFPLGSITDISQSIRAMRATNTIVMVGNSVIDHSSKCDPDARTIAQLTAADTDKSVADISNSAQLLDESLSYAGVALRNSNVETIILPVAYYSLMDRWMPSIQRGSYLNLVSLNPTKFDLMGNLLSSGIAGQDLSTHVPFVYRGHSYPDYNGIKTSYFQRERDTMSCPEDDGKDRTFLAAYYHHVYVDPPVLDRNIRAVESFVREAEKMGVRVEVVLLPIDYELMEALIPSEVPTVQHNVGRVVSVLSNLGVQVLDLTGIVPNAEFADRWCACGHLQINGRKRVAAALAADIAAPP
jgi:hypothetical protein